MPVAEHVSRVYETNVDEGKLLFDQRQQDTARRLTRLQQALERYDHPTLLKQVEHVERWESLRVSQNQQNNCNQYDTTTDAPPSISIPIPRGFYIYGEVGTGKSLLMNMLHENAPIHPSSKKRRIHFHSLLQEIHQRVHKLNKQILATHGRSFHVDTSKSRNSILQIAQELSEEVTLLCIDEFQVNDVADAMILSQFFGELWRRGVVVVATSNRPPKDLYEGGLNRSYFLPFVDMLERYCLVHHLGEDSESTDDDSGKCVDYRRVKAGANGIESNNHCGEFFYLTRGVTAQYTKHKMDGIFHTVKQQHHERGCPHHKDPLSLQVQFKRSITISSDRHHSNIIARLSFEELCTTDLGSNDYKAIAAHFRVVMLENIPLLSLKHPDRARRFITLIDELYEANCCLVCSAADVIDRLFRGEPTSDETDNDECTDSNGNILAIDAAQVHGISVGGLASVKELSFAFRRAASRLLEMCSEAWWKEKGVALAKTDSETKVMH